MSQELIYTSAPRGLKPGSRGFCTVQSTQGMARNLADQLENLSGYRHVYPPQDPQASLNPVAWSHWKLTVGGRPVHVLSRIADAGLDYTQRTNKFVHHVVLDPGEEVPAGPAWLLGSGFMHSTWDGTPRILPRGREIPAGSISPAVCQAWQSLTGDAGWAGVLAETAAGGANQPAVIVFRPGMDLLPLIAEAIALLPPVDRWEVTFSTYFTRLPPVVTCQWRCVVADTPEAVAAVRTPHAVVIDLCRPLGTAPASPLVESARTGQAVAAIWNQQKAPAAAPAGPMRERAEGPPQLHAAVEPGPVSPPSRQSPSGDAATGDAAPLKPPPRRSRGQSPLPAVFDTVTEQPKRSSGPWIAVAISAVLLIASGSAALWTYFNVTAAPQVAQQGSGSNGPEEKPPQKESAQQRGGKSNVPPTDEGVRSEIPLEETPAKGTPQNPPANAHSPADGKSHSGTAQAGGHAEEIAPTEDPRVANVPTPERPSNAEPRKPAPPPMPANRGAKPDAKPSPKPPGEVLEGFPPFAEQAGAKNEWRITLPRALPETTEIDILGGGRFYTIYEISPAVPQPSDNGLSWRIDYRERGANGNELLGHLSLKGTELRLTLNKNLDYIVAALQQSALRFRIGDASHLMLLRNPFQANGPRFSGRHENFKIVPAQFDLKNLQACDKTEIEWHLILNGMRFPNNKAGEEVVATPWEVHKLTIGFDVTSTPESILIRPKYSLAVGIPKNLTTEALLPVAALFNSKRRMPETDSMAASIDGHLSKWQKYLGDMIDNCSDIINRTKEAQGLSQEALKKGNAAAEKIKPTLERMKTSIENLRDHTTEYFSKLRIDVDIYGFVDDPRTDSSDDRIAILLMTTREDWQGGTWCREVSANEKAAASGSP